MSDTTPVLDENLHFLMNEVETHVSFVKLFFKSGSIEIYPRIRARRGYLQTLIEKTNVEANKIASNKQFASQHKHAISMSAVADALADLARACFVTVQEGTLTTTYTHPSKERAGRIISGINKALKLVDNGIRSREVRVGVKLGRRTSKLLQDYEKLQQATLEKQNQIEPQAFQAAILSNFGLKQMINALTKVGESLITANMGQAVSLDNYDRLRSVVSTLDYSVEELSVKRLALTRSGSAIASVTPSDGDSGFMAVYKEGQANKVQEEVAGVEAWNRANPGLAPRVLAHHQSDGESAAVLIEHFPGKTLEALLLEKRKEDLDRALSRLFKTLNTLWKNTRIDERAQANFMKQLAKRLPESEKVHPDFFGAEQVICGIERPSIETLIASIDKTEAGWQAPFSVLIHGDFNVDNLIYDGVDDKMRFIDLHRSGYQDYVQDISVLMISIYRLQVIEGEARRLMMNAIKKIYRFAQRFAKRQNDRYFEVRLAAGLARSFATSTRFIYDKKLATRMHLRAVYLLESLNNLSEDQERRYKIPLEVLFVE